MTQSQVTTAWCRFKWMWKVHCYPGSIIQGVCVAALLFPQHSERVRRLPSLRLWTWKLSCKTGATQLWEGAQIHTFLLRLYIPAHGNCSKQQAFQNHCCISFLTQTHIFIYSTHACQNSSAVPSCIVSRQIKYNRQVSMLRNHCWQWGG